MKGIYKALMLCMFFTSVTYAQEKIITGLVSDDSGPLPGVSVVIKGSLIGAETNFEGNYTINAKIGDVLVFSYVGMTTQEKTVGSSNTINVVLISDNMLEEVVVVVGLGQSKDGSKLAYSVSNVDTDQIIRANEADFVNALAGKSTGVQINNSSGLAGGSSRILIRGVSSLNFDNNPLYVIDGVPVSNTENLFDSSDTDQALFYGSTSGGSIDIAPDQIKNVTILKGAAASAIYGSRAANGVIVIETHKGRKNSTPVFTISSSASLSTIIEPKLQNKYALGFDGVLATGEPGDQTSVSWGPNISDIDIPIYDRFAIFRTGTTFDNSISVRGGSEASSYYASIGIYNQEGTVPTNTFDRYSFVVNSSTEVTEKLNLDAKLSYVNSINNRPFEGNGITSIMWTVAGAPISYNLLPATNPDGSQRLYRTNRNNPYFLLDNTGLSTNSNRFQPSLSLTYKLNDWMLLKGITGLDYNLASSKSVENAGVIGTYSSGRILETERTNRDFNTDVILTIDKNFSEKLTADYLVGFNFFNRKNTTLFAQGTSFIIPGFYDLSNATSLSTDEYTLEKRTYSFYGQANLGYNNFLFMTLTGRNDVSSTLPSNANSFFYYSGSLGFDLSKAFDLGPSVNRMMLRSSYSRVGNDAPEYATVTGYFTANPGDGQRGNINFPFRGTGSYLQSATQGNPNLTPEFTNELEVNADVQLFNNRLGFEVSYYDRRSEDQIFRVPLASSTGYSSIFKNAGSIQNKGIEVALNLKPIRTTNFEWNLGVNYSKNKSEVLTLADGVGSVRLAGFTNPGIFIRKGEPYGVIWTSLYKRNDDGQLLLDDNGYPQAGEVGNAGTVTPDWTGGLTTSFKYKGFELSAVMDMRVGGKIFNLDENYTTRYGTSILTAGREVNVVLDGVIESTGSPNTIAIKKDFTYWNQYAQLEEFVQKTDYIKLRNVTLSYSIPNKLIKRAGFESLRISATGRNLWMKTDDSFTGSDPELSLYGSGNGQGITNFQIPSNRSYSLGLNLTF